MKVKAHLCPCGSEKKLATCCGQYLEGKQATTAEQLMRSRYTAYVANNEKYLLETWHQSTRPQILNLTQQDSIKWVDLKIIDYAVDANNPARGNVEFIARYKLNGRAQKMHELSNFVFEDHRWYYLDGKHLV